MTSFSSRRGLRVVVVSDQAITRSALAVLLRGEGGVEAVVAAGSASDAVGEVTAGNADALICVFGAATHTLEAIREIGAAGNTPILVLAVDVEPAFVRRALSSGARGVLTTDATPDELVDALRAVVRGLPYVQPNLGAMLATQDSVRDIDVLSTREREVLRLIALGYTNPQIAQQLVVSVRTVETHRAHVVKKLAANSRAELVRYALQHGLLCET